MRAQRHAGVPLVVWLLVALHGLLLAVVSVLYPTYRAPDETAHSDMVVAVAAADRYPRVGEQFISQRFMDSRDLVRHTRGVAREPLQAADAPARDERPTLAQLGPDVPSDVVQQMAAHPPLYYVTAAAALSAVTALVPAAHDWSFDQVVGFLRLFSALLVLPLPLLAYRVAVRLRAPRATALTAAVLPLAVPQLTHIGASVNNDALLVMLLCALTLPVLRAALGDLRARTAVAAGTLGGLALLTKGFALFVPLWLAGAYALAAWRGGGRRALRAGALAATIATAVGGWWWIRNLLTHGTIQPAGLPSPPPPPGFAPDAGSWLAFFIRRMSQRFWIEPDIVPGGAPPVDLLVTVVLVAVCVAAFIAWREVGRRAGDLAVVVAPLVGLVAIVAFGAWRVYARTGLLLAIHGRYLYGAAVAIAVLAALGAAALLRGHERWLPVVALAVAAAFQLGAAGLALVEYWGPSGVRPRLAAMLAWAPWPHGLVAGAVAGAAGAALGLAVTLIREALTPPAASRPRRPAR